MKRLSQITVFASILLLLLTSLVTAQGEQTIVAILTEDGRFTTLLAAMERTESEQAFSEGEWTLFAPTDDAFAKIGLNAENINSELTLTETADLLLYQVMTSKVKSDKAYQILGDINMANGWLAGLKWYDDTMWVNDDAKVIEPDIMASNGVIHVVNNVIMPPWPRTGAETESPWSGTIEEMQQIITGPVDSETSTPEQTATEEETTTKEETAAVETPAAGEDFPAKSILGVMAADGRFTTYLAAVEGLDLIVPFSEGEWTVFAPTDDAFAQYALATGRDVSDFGVGELADLLLYHAMDEVFSSAELIKNQGDITMRNDQLAGLKYFDGSIYLNDHAIIIAPNILADNGVIHALDAVMERPWPLVETADDAMDE